MLAGRWFLFAGLLPGTLSAQALSQYVVSTEGPALVTIHAGQHSSFRIPRTIYGTFLEHIGHSVFGGVSSQLIDNPSLEPYPASPANIEKQFAGPAFRESTRFNVPLPWLPLHHDGRRYEPRAGHAANSQMSLYVMGLPKREVGIRQTIYLPVERELAYQGALFALAAEGPVHLTASLRRHDHPDDVLAAQDLSVEQQGQWVRLPFELKLASGAVAPLEAVDFAIAVKDGGRVSLDEVRLYPADALDGLDPEVVKLAADLKTPLVRYGGNFSSGYHWTDGVGPVDARPTRINEAWGIPEYNEFGTDEFMELCRRIGALPQICLNLGSGSVPEAREWVEYCQGAKDTAGGRRRAANGRSDPYPMGAWELGNELYDDTQLGWYRPDAYADRYLEFLRGIRDAVPRETPILANGAELGSYRDWNGALLRKAGGELQYVTTHLVADLEDVLDPHAPIEKTIAADLGLPVGVSRQLEGLRTQINSFPAARDRVKVAYSEWLFRSPAGSGLPSFDNMGGAVIAAAWFNMLVQHADFIPIANMTGLVEYAGVYKKRGRTFVTPQYWVLYLYSKFAGDIAVMSETRVAGYDVHGGQRFAPEIPNVPWLDVLATLNSGNGQIALFVVNRSAQKEQAGEIHVDGFMAADVHVYTLDAPSLLTHNDEEHPGAVRPVESHEAMQGGTLRHVFPAGSVSVLIFPNAAKG